MNTQPRLFHAADSTLNPSSGGEKTAMQDDYADIKKFIGEKAIVDPGGAGYIWGVDEKDGCQMIAEVRGWGAIQNLFIDKSGKVDEQKAADFQDRLSAFIVESINKNL